MPFSCQQKWSLSQRSALGTQHSWPPAISDVFKSVTGTNVLTQFCYTDFNENKNVLRILLQQTKPQIPNSSLGEKVNPICPHTQHIRITSLPYLQLQEGDVEELVQVLEAKAVLHGRLSIAEIGGARRPVASERGEHCDQHTLHRTELHTRSHPTNQPPTLKCTPGGHSAWTRYFVCS